jgi:ABC-2 type transport system permease protein
MTTASNTVPESFNAQPVITTSASATRPLYWSIRRELMENRSVYLAPLGVAAAFLLAFLISLFRLPGKFRAMAAIGPMQEHMVIAQPYDFVAMLIMGAGFIVSIF